VLPRVFPVIEAPAPSTRRPVVPPLIAVPVIPSFAVKASAAPSRTRMSVVAPVTLPPVTESETLPAGTFDPESGGVASGAFRTRLPTPEPVPATPLMTADELLPAPKNGSMVSRLIPTTEFPTDPPEIVTGFVVGRFHRLIPRPNLPPDEPTVFPVRFTVDP